MPAGFSIGGDAYLLTISSEVFQYSSQFNRWSELKEFPGEDRTQPIGFALNGVGYIGFGDGPDGPLDEFWSYHKGNDSWQKKYLFPGGPSNLSYVFVINDIAYILVTENKQLWEFDPD